MGESTQDLEGTEKENESFLSPFSEVQGIFFWCVCMRFLLLLFFLEIKNCNISLSSSTKLPFRQYAIE